jgi:hypothetical protein
MTLAPHAATRWLLLIHQLPAQPAYLRVKISRRLSGVGAIVLKNSVYVLPCSDAAHEDFQWVRREILEGGGDATVVEARLVEGVDDAEIEQRFRDSANAEYARLIEEARGLAAPLRKPSKLSDDARAQLLSKVSRLEERLEVVARCDFFGASDREAAGGYLAELRSKATAKTPAQSRPAQAAARPEVRGRTWVTRVGIQVDRIASAWLIRRFIDPEARFKFVPAKGYAPEPAELRFDMFEAEYSHEGDRCTFETLCKRFMLSAPGLSELAEVIHDIDLKDEKFRRPETAGVAACLDGICRSVAADDERLQRATSLLEGLLSHYGLRKEARR